MLAGGGGIADISKLELYIHRHIGAERHLKAAVLLAGRNADCFAEIALIGAVLNSYYHITFSCGAYIK